MSNRCRSVSFREDVEAITTTTTTAATAATNTESTGTPPPPPAAAAAESDSGGVAAAAAAAGRYGGDVAPPEYSDVVQGRRRTLVYGLIDLGSKTHHELQVLLSSYL